MQVIYIQRVRQLESNYYLQIAHINRRYIGGSSRQKTLRFDDSIGDSALGRAARFPRGPLAFSIIAHLIMVMANLHASKGPPMFDGRE